MNQPDSRDVLRKDCPPLERLTALLEQKLAADESDAMHRHIAACQFCDTDWRMLTEFVEARVEPSEQADLKAIVAGIQKARKPAPVRRASWFSLPRLAAALSAVVLVVALGIQLQLQKTTDLGGFKDSGSVRSSQHIDILTKGDFSVLPSDFSWTSVNSAVTYLIVVSEVDGTVLWRGQSGVNDLKLSEQVRTLLLPKKTVVLQVTAVDSNGAHLAQSDATRVRFLPESVTQ